MSEPPISGDPQVLESLLGAPEGEPSEDAMTRRVLLRRGAMLGGIVAGSSLIAACGGSSGGATTAAVATSTSASSGASSLGHQLQSILGTPKNLLAHGPGSFKVDGQFPLTGAGAIYGKLQTDGWKYGVQHVEAWTQGRVSFSTKYYDNKSGVPAAEAAAGRQAGLDGVPVLISSYNFGFGAILPFSKEYKMFTPDPGGGVGPVPGPFVDKPYAYGFRAGFPTDMLDGIFKYLRQTFPTKTRWVTVQPVIAPPWNDAVKAYEANLFKQYGGDWVGEVMAPLGATDYSSTVQKIKALNPDVVYWSSFGTDPGYQAKEMLRQGLNVINAASDFTPALAKLGGSAIKNWYFGLDYLNTVHPPSAWSQLFVTNWAKDHGGAVPSFYNAGDYVTAFAVALLMDRILGAGGDIHSGDAYVKALEQDPSFPHVYGGSGSSLGQMVIDTTTHSPKAIPLLLFQSLGTGNVKDIKPIATYNLKASDFKLI